MCSSDKSSAEWICAACRIVWVVVNCRPAMLLRAACLFPLIIRVNIKEKLMDTKKVFPVNPSSESDEQSNQIPSAPLFSGAEKESDQIPSANPSSAAGDKETSDLPQKGGSLPFADGSPKADGNPKKDVLVLVVDDIVDNVALLSLDLQHEGYRVITASNGEEAVKVAFLMRPNIILMDISMPLLDGLGATTKIREDESLRNVPIVAVTAFSTAGFRRAAYDVGFDGYLTKPIDFDQLHELINRLLA